MESYRYYVQEDSAYLNLDKISKSKKLISIDWFQYCCFVDGDKVPKRGTFVLGKEVNPKGYISNYEVCDAQEFHSIYRYSFTIKLHGWAVCHIHCVPKSSALDPRLCAVKMANRILYTKDWAFYFRDVCNAFHLEPHNLTRVDLCCDFQRFDNDMLPNEFIRAYLADGLINDVPTFIRKGSNKMVVQGIKKLLKDGTGREASVTGTYTSWEYLRFGSRNSGVCTYLYNKSKELADKKSKPYIKAAWEEAGIIEDKELPVYRLEMSILAKGSNVRKRSKAMFQEAFGDFEFRALNTDDFSTQKRLDEIFWTYQQSYFVFHACKGQKYRKDMPIVNLLVPTEEVTLKPCQMCKSYDTGIAERNASKCLERIVRTFPSMPPTALVALTKASRTLDELGVAKMSQHMIELADIAASRLLKFGERSQQLDLDFLGFDEGVDYEGEAWRRLQTHGIMSPRQSEMMKRLVRKEMDAIWNLVTSDPIVWERVVSNEIADLQARELMLLEREWAQDPDTWTDDEGVVHQGCPF